MSFPGAAFAFPSFSGMNSSVASFEPSPFVSGMTNLQKLERDVLVYIGYPERYAALCAMSSPYFSQKGGFINCDCVSHDWCLPVSEALMTEASTNHGDDEVLVFVQWSVASR